MRKKVLGRGLEALIPRDIKENVSASEKVIDLRVDEIVPNPHQPREVFGESELQELAQSIKENGIIQPIVVRRSGDRYELVAGERRLRASSILGLEKIPALVREIDDENSLKLALLENLQREDLNPLEKAAGFKALKEELGVSTAEIGRALGKGRSTVANTIRLLRLPEEVKKLIHSGEISEGHARAILSIEGEREQVLAAQQVVKESLTVRDLEKDARPKRRASRADNDKDPEIRALEERLEIHLGTRVKIRPGAKGGVIKIRYYSNEQFEGVLENMGIDTRSGL
ncbi:MAG: ParB/RepB/Spo0J family partition protein [Candidatus Latescibacteria bacterium]|nr:ParB/RepB/Spo0J family partition protein [bacterium]MBD3425418.1 ParB/RepB/Spo0J family partition protein [Candidatus Latescibacterota bacterium]